MTCIQNFNVLWNEIFVILITIPFERTRVVLDKPVVSFLKSRLNLEILGIQIKRVTSLVVYS